MKVYLASPLFTEYEREKVKEVAAKLREEYEVYVPMEHQIENAWKMSNWIWARKVFEEDIKQIQNCDFVVCIYYGLYSDSGTAWECGYAYGIGKEVKLLDYSNNEVSLMMVNGSYNSYDYENKWQT